MHLTRLFLVKLKPGKSGMKTTNEFFLSRFFTGTITSYRPVYEIEYISASLTK